MTIRNFSVSQVDTYLDCARKHFFKSILRLPDPSNEAAQRGTSIHKAAENTSAMLEKGALLTEALDAHSPTDAPWMTYVRAIAQAGVLPEPNEPHAREHRFSLPTHTGIPFIGLIDQIRDELKPIDLCDFKSTSDIRYAKTPLELTTNLQLNAYAHYIFQNVPDDVVRARLVYVEAKKVPLKKKLPRVVNVHVDLTRESVRRIWEGEIPFGDQSLDLRLPSVLDRMIETAKTEDFNDVPPTTTTCTKYGGCPYRAKCGLSPFAGIEHANDHYPKKRITIEESKNMGFLSGKTNGSTTPAPQKTAPPMTTPEPTAPPAKSTGFLARANAAKAAAPAPAAKPTEEERQAKLDQDFPVPTGVVPPDAPSRMTEVAAAPEPEVEAEAPVEEAPKRGRGRPRKTPDIMTEHEGHTIPPVAASTSKRKEFILMIDCMVTKGAGGAEPTHLDDFFATIEMEMNELAAAEEGVVSYWLLPFGPQKAVLATKVQERIAKGLPPVMVVRSSSNAAREVLPFLIPHATQIIQALRG